MRGLRTLLVILALEATTAGCSGSDLPTEADPIGETLVAIQVAG